MFDDLDDEDRAQRRLGAVVTLLCGEIRLETPRKKRLQRLRDAEADLMRCIEARGEPLLDDGERALLELERSFQPEGAIGRVAGADLLLLVLRHYVDEAEWEGVDDEDRRVRIRLALDLGRTTAQLPEVRGLDVGCALLELESAVRRARRRLLRDQQARRLSRMDPVLREQIERQIDATLHRTRPNDAAG